MEQEYTGEQFQEENPSYWSAVMVAGVITGILYSVLGIISAYVTVNSEPGAIFGAGTAIGTLACLLAGVGGIIVNRQYAKEHDVTYKIGKGALLGLLTSVAAVVIATVFSLIWMYVIDPDLQQALYDWQIANLEAIPNMTDEMLEQQINNIPEPGSMKGILMSSGFGLIGLAIVNVITGLIGAKIYASEE